MDSNVETEFRSEIEELARSAEREFADKQGDLGRPAAQRKRLTRILWIGGVLIVLELGFLGFQLMVREEPTVTADAKPHPLQDEQSCAGAKYRTFRALVDYRKDHGRWPVVLGEIVGDYVPTLPTDPTTGIPLIYFPRGEGFTLDCNPR